MKSIFLNESKQLCYIAPVMKVARFSVQRHILSPTTGSTINDAGEEDDDIFGE